jgi:WD40 repeat protein
MFDPYFQWFGIPGNGRLPTCYELLGIAPAEDRAEVIKEAALRRTARIRRYQTGAYAEACTRLLNEIARAELTLLNQVRRAERDAGLGELVTAEQRESCAAGTEEGGAPAAVAVMPQDDIAPIDFIVLEPLTLSEVQRPPACHGRGPAVRTRFRAAPALALAGALLFLVTATTTGIVTTLAGRRPDPRNPGAADFTIQPPIPERVRLAEQPGELRRFEGQLPVHGVAFSPDGRTILAGGGGYVKGPGNSVVPRECAARLWDVATGDEVRRFAGHTAPVRCVGFSPDGRHALTGGGGYESRNGSPVAVDCTVRLWDVGSGGELRCFTGHTAPVVSVAFFPDGRTAASAGRDGTVRLWDVWTGTELRRLEPEPGTVNSVAVSLDGRFLLCGGQEGILRLWDVAGGQGPRRLPQVEEQITSVAFSPEGRQALCASVRWDTRLGRQKPVSGALRLWDLETASEVRVFAGQIGPVESVAFSPDGRRAVSGGSDETVRLWDVAGGRELNRFKGHAGVVEAVAFSPDGRRALSAGQDGTTRLWALPQ